MVSAHGIYCYCGAECGLGGGDICARAFRLLFNVVSTSVVVIVTGRLKRFREIRVKVARALYISFARLDPRTLKILKKFRLSKKAEYRFKEISIVNDTIFYNDCC